MRLLNQIYLFILLSLIPQVCSYNKEQPAIAKDIRVIANRIYSKEDDAKILKHYKKNWSRRLRTLSDNMKDFFTALPDSTRVIEWIPSTLKAQKWAIIWYGQMLNSKANDIGIEELEEEASAALAPELVDAGLDMLLNNDPTRPMHRPSRDFPEEWGQIKEQMEGWIKAKRKAQGIANAKTEDAASAEAQEAWTRLQGERNYDKFLEIWAEYVIDVKLGKEFPDYSVDMWGDDRFTGAKLTNRTVVIFDIAGDDAKSILRALGRAAKAEGITLKSCGDYFAEQLSLASGHGAKDITLTLPVGELWGSNFEDLMIRIRSLLQDIKSEIKKEVSFRLGVSSETWGKGGISSSEVNERLRNWTRLATDLRAEGYSIKGLSVDRDIWTWMTTQEASSTLTKRDVIQRTIDDLNNATNGADFITFSSYLGVEPDIESVSRYRRVDCYKVIRNNIRMEIKSYRTYHDEPPFNEFKITATRSSVHYEVAKAIDHNADGTLDEEFKGMVPLEKLQPRYVNMINSGLVNAKLIKVKGAFLVREK